MKNYIQTKYNYCQIIERFILIILLLFFSACLQYPRDSKHVKQWDLTRTDFKNVLLALKNNNSELAAKTIVAYYDKRTVPDFPLSPETIKKEAINDNKNILKAEKILKNQYDFLNQKITVGKIIPWTQNPSQNPEWLWELNRHYGWVTLARAYVLTGDERYARCFSTQVQDWINRNPPSTDKNELSPTWRLLETGLRMSESWIRAYSIFRHSPSVDWKVKWLMLNSIHDQAAFLAKFHTAHNHLVMESNGLASVAAYFPEFKDAPKWGKIAFARLTNEINKQVLPDGVHFEEATHYQWTVAGVFEKSLHLAELVGNKTFKNVAVKTLRKMYRFLAYAVRPDGKLPMINDGVSENIRKILLKASKKYNYRELAFAATAGKLGKPFNKTSNFFEYGGFAILRSGWNANSSYLIFDLGPFGGDHGHEDLLNFELWAFGKSMLVDPGTYSYDFNDPFRQYFISSSAHNLVLVNGYGQCRRARRIDPELLKPHPVAGLFKSTNFADIVSALYYGDYGINEEAKLHDIRHHRIILFVKPDYYLIADFINSPYPVTCDLLFHFSPEMGKPILKPKSKQCFCPSDTAKLLILPALTKNIVSAKIIVGEINPIQGWYAPDFNIKRPSPVLDYKSSKRKQIAFYTLLFPMKKGKNKHLNVNSFPITVKDAKLDENKGICLQINEKNRKDFIFITDNIHGEKYAANLKSNSFVNIFRQNSKGKIIKRFPKNKVKLIQ